MLWACNFANEDEDPANYDDGSLATGPSGAPDNCTEPQQCGCYAVYASSSSSLSDWDVVGIVLSLLSMLQFCIVYI